jgi:hypothetical protein
VAYATGEFGNIGFRVVAITNSGDATCVVAWPFLENSKGVRTMETLRPDIAVLAACRQEKDVQVTRLSRGGAQFERIPSGSSNGLLADEVNSFPRGRPGT